MAHLLGADSIRLAFPNRTVLDGVSLGLEDGDSVGVVGRNGDGKSSLLRLLAGRTTPDSGRVTLRRGTSVGLLDQTDSLDPEATVGHAVVGDAADHEWASDPRARSIIDGLLADVPWDQPVGALSGGQRRRTALAALLVQDPDVLLLDEPTNHLDVEGVTWLANHLKERSARGSGAFAVVTHDRWFLDEVTTATWEVHDGIVEPFEGGYAAYVLARVERDRQAATVAAKRANLMKKELAWLRRGAPARTSKPKFRIDAANALIADVPPVRDSVALTRMATARLGKDVVELVDASVSYVPGTDVLDRISWILGPGDRVGILGANGAGKSTLLGLVTGTLAPTAGRVKRGRTVEAAWLSQDLAELTTEADKRVADVIAPLRVSMRSSTGDDLTPGQVLERLGFTSAHLATPVRDLSGGQKRRLQLALTLLGEPNVLVLDEPTNDMDTDMLAAMEDLLDGWPGTLVVVSHDRYLLERVTDDQYAVLDGSLRHLPGGVEEYLALRAHRGTTTSSSPPSARSAASGSVAAPAPGTPTGTTPASPAAQPGGAARHASRKELASIERKLDKRQADAVALHEEMAAHDVADYAGLAALGARLRAVEAEIGELEERWLELSETLG
ncbi:MAG: ABC-F family ATP-binding cassette domain-containing protein [Salana multivorans]|uniref:ABC-F family ATP-binding cassette domain-containing protein n=1 Tax=Salana multivorans TaxID=120377 RepID=UPI00096289BD|nr:ABC-F family ATP-binding cassette domain-containing protein [Salana multivorans]MBN8883463.1 ABC-F family ATP-binding cassette domain-containing protein [Salana multivorans]OJX94015.1 MAG: ABC transporter ATP-binding protein [Micrococcales bacterium 73-15]